MKLRIELEYSHYSVDGVTFCKGERFISLNYEYIDSNCGGGGPCKSRSEVIKWIRQLLYSNTQTLAVNVSEKDIEIIDNTSEGITKEEVLGQDLRKWL